MDLFLKPPFVSLIPPPLSQLYYDYRNKLCVHVCSFMSDSATPWTAAHQAPLPMGFPRQEYWSRLPFPPPGDLPDPGIKPGSPALAGGFLKHWTAREVLPLKF